MTTDIQAIIGVPPFDIHLGVLHVWGRREPVAIQTRAAVMALQQATAGWHVSVAAASPGAPESVDSRDWNSPADLLARAQEVDPDVVVAHGTHSALLARRVLRDQRTIVCVSPTRKGGGLRDILAEHRTSRWCNAMVVPDARTSQWFRDRGVRVPIFLVDPGSAHATQLWAAVTARAYAFGG